MPRPLTGHFFLLAFTSPTNLQKLYHYQEIPHSLCKGISTVCHFLTNINFFNLKFCGHEVEQKSICPHISDNLWIQAIIQGLLSTKQGTTVDAQCDGGASVHKTGYHRGCTAQRRGFRPRKRYHLWMRDTAEGYSMDFITGQNGGATISISSLRTGCTNFMRREWSEMLPSGLERGAPYLRSPFITHPIAESWARIW